MQSSALARRWQEDLSNAESETFAAARDACERRDFVALDCMQRHRAKLAFGVERLATTPDADLPTAVNSLSSLTVEAPCSEQARAATSEEREALRRKIDQLNVLLDLRRLDEARAALPALEPDLLTHGDPATRSDALAVEAELLLLDGRHEQAAARLEQAVWTAVQGDISDATIRYASRLAAVRILYFGDLP